MATFSYKARTTDGEMVSGILTADNQQAALRRLDERRLFPMEVREGGMASRSALTGRRKRIKLRALVVMYSQLADLLRAGVPVLRSLDILSRQTSNAALAEILREVRDDVSGGTTLADAMERHPNAFSELHVAMVRAGERGGFLEDVLNRIAGFAERQNELRAKVIGSLVYPAVLVFAGTALVTVLMVVVVPQIRQHLDLTQVPWITIAVFAVSDFVKQHGFLLLGGLTVIGIMLIAYARSGAGRRRWDRIRLTAPVAGKIVRMVAICRFCRILGTLLANGVPVLQALRISKESTGNRVLAEEIERAAESVRKGESLASPLGASGLFPLDIVDIIAVAEESNTLEKVLIETADSNERRTGQMIDLAVRLIEPVMLLIMAGLIFCVAFALLLPILTMSGLE
jgi:general secretion pathway protein F